MDIIEAVNSFHYLVDLVLGASHYDKKITVIIGFATCAGCTNTVMTTVVEAGHPSPAGVAYYLPKRLVTVNFTRKLSEASAKLGDAAAKAEAARDSQAPKIKIEKGATISGAQNDFSPEQAALEAAVTDSEVAVRNGESPYVDTITVTVSAAVADSSIRLVASLNHSALRHDEMTLKTSPQGLLSNSDVKSEDQTAQIIVSLADAVFAFGGGGAVPSTLNPKSLLLPLSEYNMAAVKPKKLTVDCGNGFKSSRRVLESAGEVRQELVDEIKFDLTFDPSRTLPLQSPVKASTSSAKGSNTVVNVDPLDYLSSALCSRGADYQFRFTVKPNPMSDNPTAVADIPGLYYRRDLPYVLDVKRRNALTERRYVEHLAAQSFDYSESAGSFQMELPNQSPLEWVDLRGGAFTTVAQTTEFKDGLLVSHKEDRPGEVLSIVSLPFTIAQEAIKIPAQILSLRVDYTSNQEKLAAGQEALLKAVNSLKACQQKGSDCKAADDGQAP